jgi:VanZ family protein
MKKFLYYWLPVLVYAGLIFYFSSLPAIPPVIIKIIPETLIWHMIEYAIFSVLLFRALTNTNNIILRNHATLIAIIISTLYGISDETHQLFVPGRIFSYYDMIADFIGSTFILTKNIIAEKNIKLQLKIHF